MKKTLPDFRFVIAGGAVRDSLIYRKPKDYDLFILDEQDKQHTQTKVYEYCNSLEMLEANINASSRHVVKQIRIGDDIVQIIWTNKKTVNELLDSFDWNISLFAYDGERVISREDIHNINPGKELYLQNVTDSISSLRRGFIFSDRFKMKIRDSDLIKLCKNVYREKQAEDMSNI